MEQGIQLFAAISFLVIGLSHLVRPRLWVNFFQALAARGTAGVFLEGFLLLDFGGIIVGFLPAVRGSLCDFRQYRPCLSGSLLWARRSDRALKQSANIRVIRADLLLNQLTLN